MVEKQGENLSDDERNPIMGGASSMLSPSEGEKSDRMGFIRKVYGILGA